MGGPSVDPKNGGNRRGIYFLHSRDQKDKFLTMFDDADRLACYRRAESIVPQQALALSNSKLAIEMAGKIAASISGDDAAFAKTAFETILCRTPDPEELDTCREFLTALGGKSARTRLVQSLLNHNDFVTMR